MAGPRYPFWHARYGDVDASSEARDIGKKLLGEMQASINAGGPKTQVRRQVAPDGTVVEANMNYGMPSVRFSRSERSADRTDLLMLDGIVVTPGTPGPTEFDEVLLQPKGEWQQYFFSAEVVPATLAGPFPYYGRAFGRPVFDEPDGLKYSGVADWRNANETMLVSWAGPRTRYFPDGSGRGTKVYFKGKVLFDLAPYASALFGAGSNALVNGACLRKHNGLWLLVAVRLGGSSINKRDGLIAVPLRRPIGATSAHAPQLWMEPRLEPALNEDNPVDDIRTLLDAPFPNDVTDEEHPWFFNQAGTEARCIRREYYLAVHEYVLAVDDELTSASVNRISEAWPVVTTTVTRTDTYAPLQASGTWGILDNMPPGTDPPPIASGKLVARYGGATGVPEPEKIDTLVAYDVLTTRVCEDAKCAVDFVDNVPVYAYWNDGSYTETSTGTSDPRSNHASGITDSDIQDIPDGMGGFYTDVLVGLSSAGTAYERNDWETGLARNGVDWALRTPWGDIAMQRTVTESGSGTVSMESAWSNSQSVVNQTPGPGNIPESYSYLINSFALSTPGSTTTWSMGSTFSTETRREGLGALHYLDLRSQIVVYSEEVRREGYDEDVVPNPTTISFADFTPYGGFSRFEGNIAFVGSESFYFQGLTPVPHFGYWNAPPGSGDPTRVGTITRESFDENTTNLLVKIGDHELSRTLLGTASLPSTTGPSDFNIRRGVFGSVMKQGTFGFRYADRGGPGDPLDLSAWILCNQTDRYELESTTPDSGTANTVQSVTSALSGAWQTYSGRYAYSMRALNFSAEFVYVSGIGDAQTGTPSTETLVQLTGYIDTPPRFWPVWVLTPTYVATIRP